MHWQLEELFDEIPPRHSSADHSEFACIFEGVCSLLHLDSHLHDLVQLFLVSWFSLSKSASFSSGTSALGAQRQAVSPGVLILCADEGQQGTIIQWFVWGQLQHIVNNVVAWAFVVVLGYEICDWCKILWLENAVHVVLQRL